ncbi:uncharacterized protein LOC135338768 isoform X2 [Halichondria panicea]|uniref:uncharacterized protein LOC135338768 isoform X2 n=1 Tax=Halichondria panicea TaxID=6063 RepID=UPI00312B7F9E
MNPTSSKNRTFGSTNANEHSSRSHTIFKLTIESRVRDEERTIRVASLLHLKLKGKLRGLENWTNSCDKSALSKRRLQGTPKGTQWQ